MFLVPKVSGGCPDLPAPGHGAMACDVWLGGRLCHPSCANGYSVLVTNPLPGLVICSNDGIWLRGNEITNCHCELYFCFISLFIIY